MAFEATCTMTYRMACDSCGRPAEYSGGTKGWGDNHLDAIQLGLCAGFAEFLTVAGECRQHRWLCPQCAAKAVPVAAADDSVVVSTTI